MGDNWCTHRDMDSVQESSRCKQTKPSLWPTRPAGRIREPSARSRVRWCSARGSHGMPHVLSGLAPRPRKPEGRTRNREARDRPEGITPTGGSAPNEAHTPNQHTRRKDTLGTPTDRSQQHAIGSWQMAVGSAQYRKEVTPHMHTPTTTHPQDRHTQGKSTPPPTLGEPTRPAHPDPASAAEPAPPPAPAPAPARSWTPDGPARRTDRTDRTPTTTAAAATAASVATAQARQPRQPRPRSDTPTPATPAPVAASPNPNRHGDPTRQHTAAPAPHHSVAACLNRDRDGTPLRRHTGPQPRTTPSLPRLNLNRHGASARQHTLSSATPASVSLPPAARPKPAWPQPATSANLSPLRR